MAGLSIVLKATRRGLNAVTKKLSDESLFEASYDSLQDSLDELKTIVVAHTPVASGETAGNIFTDIEGSSLNDLHGIVASPDAWFPVLEYGRRAGARMPPQYDIEQWMETVGIEPSAQFVIRRSISRKGLPALHIMRNALQEGRSKFKTIWFDRFLKDFGEGGRPEEDF